MRRTASILLAGALALGAVAANDGETPEDLTDHPCYDETVGDLVYPEQQVFFQEGESKLGNTSETPHPWGTEAPTSVTTGAGAGQVTASSQAGGGETNTVFEGTFEGCIGTMLFDIYSFDPTNRSSTAADGEPNDHTFTVTVSVDGLPAFSSGTAQAATTYGTGAFGPNLNRFALDLSGALESFAEAGFGGFTLDGTHTVTLEIAPYYINTGAATVYVWDTAESPSGITFNRDASEDYPVLN